MPLRFTRMLRTSACFAALTPLFLLAGCGPTNMQGTVSELTATSMTLTVSAVLLNSGSTLTLTGTVNPSAAPGYVAFFDGTTSIGVAPLSAGTATLAISTLASGSHSITVGYGGSSAYYASNSGAITVNVM